MSAELDIVDADIVPQRASDAAFIARQAAALEDAIDLADTGAFARRRGAVDSSPAFRPAVAATNDRLLSARVELLMWTIHGRCSGVRLDDGTPWPAHPVEVHRRAAEDGVRILFPQAVV